MVRLFGITLLSLLLAAQIFGQEKQDSKIFPYTLNQFTLDNGLKIVSIPFDSPGIIAYYTVVRTGSRNEIEPGKSGFAHFFEHMMFRGTSKYPTPSSGWKIILDHTSSSPTNESPSKVR